MNKLVKGSIAGAAGIALLLGGAGTLAYWNDSAALTGAGTVTAGELDIASTAAGDWDMDITNIVPGDTLTYTESFTVTATGDNLAFEIGSNFGSLVSGITGATVTPTFVVSDGIGTVAPVSGVYTQLGEGGYTIDATIVVSFPTTVSDQTGQLESTVLSGGEITVTQVAVTP